MFTIRLSAKRLTIRKMDRNVRTTESSLLLQLPNSAYTYSGNSGSSFLMPVAVENVVGSVNNSSNVSSISKSEESVKCAEPASVCQLQQPLMMSTKSSNEGKPAVSEYSSQVLKTESVSENSEPFPYDAPIPEQLYTSQNNLASSIFGPSPQFNTEYSSFQNQQLAPPLFEVQSKCPEQNEVSSPANSFESGSVLSNTNIIPNTTSVPSGSFDRNGGYCYQNSPASEFISQSTGSVPSITPDNQNIYGRNYNLTNSNTASQNYVAASSYDAHTPKLHSAIYEPASPYWLFKDVIETKDIWCGFSSADSERLERMFQQDPEAVVPVDGGRYDAKLNERIKRPVYSDSKDMEIRRCTWFYQPDSSQRFLPFSEEAANLLEQHYLNCVTSGQWQRRVLLPGMGSVNMESPHLLFWYKNEVEFWPQLPDSKASPRDVSRGLPENFECMPDENSMIDHLVFIVQGIGSFCDLKFRTVSECVDGFRDIANKLLTSHFANEVECGQVRRVEFLPLAWHAKLHTNDKGFDRAMKNITLPSIPKLRYFTNDTLLDILLYSSPSYCQCIIDTVASELNKLHKIFLKRNPEFKGKVFVAGHSLGSLILFDILANQQTENKPGTSNEFSNNYTVSLTACDRSKVTTKDYTETMIQAILQSCKLEEYIDASTVLDMTVADLRNLGLPDGPCKQLIDAIKGFGSSQRDQGVSELESSTTLNSDFKNERSSVKGNCLTYPIESNPCMSTLVFPELHFEPAGFFALGSPIAMFLTVRGYDTVSEDFKLPTCPAFFHIFHPYDPVAFRIEPLIDPNFSEKPVLIPHHKGRKRMHLEIRENLSKVGLEIKQKVLETLKYTWNSLSGFAKSQTYLPAAVEAEVDKIVNRQMSESEFEVHAPSECSVDDVQIGSLNGGRRIDYVLQEKPIEALNDYIFALTSHATYWDSEDTVLMILKEIYASQGIFASPVLNENKNYSPSGPADSRKYTQLNSVMSEPCLYQNSEIGGFKQGNFASYEINQSLPSNIPVTTPCMADSAPVPLNILTAVPHPAASQSVGPPPLTGFVKKSPFAK